MRNAAQVDRRAARIARRLAKATCQHPRTITVLDTETGGDVHVCTTCPAVFPAEVVS